MHDANVVKSPLPGEWLDDFFAGFWAYLITSLPVLLGVLFGANIVSRPAKEPIAACIRFDAKHYLTIMRNGYQYEPTRRSVVAFFPAYPLLARWLGQATGLPLDEAALLAANVFLVGAFVFLARWTRVRWPEATDEQRLFVLAVFGFWPLGVFFRVPYAESLFLFAAFALLYGMACRWPLVVLALLAGFLTAVRPVGVAATAAFLWHVFSRSGVALRTKIVHAVLLAPLALAGLMSYVLFQQMEFENPLAFAQTQENWKVGAPTDYDWQDKLAALVTLEPIRGVYDPDSSRYWRQFEPGTDALFSLMFWNPLFFVLAVGLLALGGLKRWLSGTETVFGFGLLAIPYVTRAFEMSMASHARFAALAVTAYLAIGRGFAHASPAVRLVFCLLLGTFLCLLTSLYVSGHLIY